MTSHDVAGSDMDLGRDAFVQALLRELVRSLDDVVGDHDARGMITSNVFGRMASEHLGNAKVELQETIAEGHGRCTVVVHLKPGPDTDAVPGRVYYRAID